MKYDPGMHKALWYITEYKLDILFTGFFMQIVNRFVI